MLLKTYLKNTYCLSRELAPSSIEQFEVAIGRFSGSVGHDATLADLSDDTIQACLAGLLDAGKSRATVNKIRRLILCLARHCRKQTGYTPDVPCLSEKRTPPKAWTVAQMAKLLECATKVAGWGPTLRALLLTYYETGIRMRDALGILSEDCDLPERIIGLVEKKTGQRRVFEITHQTETALAALDRLGCVRPIAEGDGAEADHLIPYRFKTLTPLRRALRKALKAAGLPATRKDLFQKVRRTAATQASAAGCDATAFLGHSAKWVTDTFYIDPAGLPPTRVSASLPRLV